jgi:hypothetical protein
VSIKVEMGELAARVGEYEFAYLVTVGDDGRSHVLGVLPEQNDDGFAVGGVGQHSIENATARPDVTLVWPPASATGFSLIVDGTATVGDGSLTVTPRKAILHRPALGDDGRRTGSDCRPV